MIQLPIPPLIAIDGSIRFDELQVWLKFHKLLQDNPLLLSPLHPLVPSVMRGVPKGRLVHGHLWISGPSTRCASKEVLDVHLEVRVGEMPKMFKEFPSELELY